MCVCVLRTREKICVVASVKKNGKMSKHEAYVKKIDSVCSIWGQLRECKSWISRFLHTQSVKIRGHRLAQSLCNHTNKRPQKEEVESAEITFSLSLSLSLSIRGWHVGSGGSVLSSHTSTPHTSTASQLFSLLINDLSLGCVLCYKLIYEILGVDTLTTSVHPVLQEKKKRVGIRYFST